MTIEDVDYLVQNSELQSLTLVIDSRERDYNTYNTPSEYSIGFDEPIKNVVGFEILDASIPVTEFSIDKHNNKLCFGYIFHTTGVTIDDACKHFTNYLQFSSIFRDLFENDSDSNIFLFENYNLFLTEKQKEISDESHNILVYYSIFTLGLGIGSGLFTIKSPYGKIYKCEFDPSLKEYYFINETTVYVYDIVYVTLDTAIELALSLKTNTQNFSVLYCNIYKEIPIRNYTSNKLYTLFNEGFLTNSVSNAVLENSPLKVKWEDDPVSITDISITQKFIWILESVKQYCFFLDFDKSTCSSALGFSEYNSERLTSKLRYRDYKKLFISKIGEIVNTAYSQIISPGLISLEDVRYVELHCPEIESHILGSYSYFKYAPGIGLFKLVDTNTISHLRFDFLNIIRKPFHPIGKLSRLTLQFTNRKGNLYDFKGIDHTILVSIKYYAPKQNHRLPRSVLNKMYQPDLLSYKLKGNKSYEKHKYLEDLMQEQNRYLI